MGALLRNNRVTSDGFIFASDPERSPQTSIRDLLVLAAVVLVGLAFRLDFMKATGFTIDGDEAIVGLMGLDILDGRGIPVFYYGQHYMGSLEAIMASGLFAIFGASPFTLQLVPLVWSLALIVVAYILGILMSSRRAGLIAAALTAVAPPALMVWSSKARGGFIEVVVIGAVALCLTIKWLRSDPGQLRYPVLIGLVLGLGWWVNNQIIYFILPIAIFGLAQLITLFTSKSSRNDWAGVKFRQAVRIVFFGALAFLIGGLPYWLYNLRHGFPSAGMFKAASWQEFWEHLEGLRMTALPAIVGAQRFWQRLPVFPYSRHIALLLYVFPIALLVLARWRQWLGLLVARVDRKCSVELLVLFCLSCCFVFSFSSFGWLVQAPRYLLPFYVGLYPLIGICCDALWKRSRALGGLYLAALLCFQVASSYVGGRGISGEPVVYGGQRVARDHGELIDTLDRMGISRIRANYWVGYRLAFETKQRITFTVLGEPTQARIPRYEETDPVNRALLPLVLVQSEVAVVKPALGRFGYSFKEQRAGEYTILYDLKNEVPQDEAINLATHSYQAHAYGVNDPALALDGRVDTRWGSGGPQSPGQTFEVEFNEATIIDGVRYSYGAWFNDRPAELQVEVEDSSGTRSVVLSRRESPGALHLSARDPYFTLRFNPTLVKKVILTQMGRHPVLDWSIAELSFFGPKNDLPLKELSNG
jgi:hypothetical protein